MGDDIFSPLSTSIESLRKTLMRITADGLTFTFGDNGMLETTAEPVEESEQEEQKQERKTSEWRHIEGNIYECKNCLITTEVDENFGSPAYKFCPYCGAEMIIYNL
jgi:rubrerythrin